ncbi:flagellin FliC [Bordetella parapertussis]|uniref:Flagellin n=2 Tax=Bordetella parapertussis TaxID=519 RepID=Q7WAB4_BORPA|nr:flagellin FliC [Bordetella parapertussis]AOB38677.1 flagellin [Bordetella parapertussis]AUL42667.1 flagellin [Bordetella parapertussis]AWP63812.1 flagellin [Bordetella parapertussis]AWP71316.1 flagellin [Bordetella parapertussis]AWP88668.1 flagellin [Bordetella parapertussis]
MAAVINTNYLSLVAQNNLNKSQSALGSAIERLSSGLRINSAKDDAAGQAIANRFTANVKGLTQAARNANDGISIAQTTEGALNEINNNLQRIRELTVQASNGTNSASDIDSIQQEVNQRLEEINRIAEQTDFNGIKVLKSNATDMTLSIQVGAKDNETIDIKIDRNSNWNLYDAVGTVPGGTVNGEARTVNALGFDVLSAVTTTIASSDTVTFDAAVAAAEQAAGAAVGDGSVVSYGDTANPQYAVVVDNAGTMTSYALTFDKDGKAALGDQLGAVASQAAEAAVGTNDVAAGANVTVSGGAADALSKLDDAMKAVDEQRSSLGAIQNRFESTVANLNNTITNLSAARSRIEDSDYATEVSNMTKNQILQQAGTSVLAQANQVPQNVLSLLR